MPSKMCSSRGGVRLLGANIGGDLDVTGALLVSTRYGEYLWRQHKTIDPDCLKCLRHYFWRSVTPEADRTMTDTGRVEYLRQFCERVDALKRDLTQSVEARRSVMPEGYKVGEPRFKSLDISNALIGRHVKLRRRFRALGEVSLNSANIGGAVLVRGASFFEPDGVALSMDAVRIRKDLYIQHNDIGVEKEPFIAEGAVSMRGAKVSHRFVCSDAFFCVHRRSEDGVSTLRSSPMQEREVYALFAKRLHVGGDLMLNRAEEEGGNPAGMLNYFVSLENASIGGRLFIYCEPNVATNNQLPFLNLDFAEIKGSMNLTIMPASESCRVRLFSTSAGSIDIHDSDLDKVTWDLRGLKYNAVEKYEMCKCDAGKTKGIDAWIGKVLTTAIQPYDSFFSFLMKTGDEKGAWKVGIAKEDNITAAIKRDMVAALRAKSFEASAELLAYFIWRSLLKWQLDTGIDRSWRWATWRRSGSLVSLYSLAHLAGTAF